MPDSRGFQGPHPSRSWREKSPSFGGREVAQGCGSTGEGLEWPQGAYLWGVCGKLLEVQSRKGEPKGAEASFFTHFCPQHLLLEEMDELGNWPPE